MLDELRLFKELKSENPGVSDLDILEYLELDQGYGCPELREAISLGIDPIVGHGAGRIDKRFFAALAKARAEKEKIRVHNNCAALEKGVTDFYVTPFPSDAHAYTLRRVREWQAIVHRETKPNLPAAQVVNGLEANRDLKSAFLQVMQDSLK